MSEPTDKAFVLSESVPYLIARVGTLVEESIEPQLKDEGLTIEMWRVLCVLHQDGEHNLIELSRATSIKPSTLSRLAGRMIKTDLIARTRSTEDNRTVRVRIRKAGSQKVRRLSPRAHEVQSQLIAPFSPGERPLLKDFLNRLYRVLAPGAE